MKWETGIPGKEGTDWAGGVFKVIFEFPDECVLTYIIYIDPFLSL